MRHPAIQLMNSLHLDGRGGCEDRLLDDAWLGRYADRWDLGAVSGDERGRLHALRAVLREVVESSTVSGQVDPGALDRLNATLPPVRRTLRRGEDAGELVLRPDTGGLAAGARVALAFAELLAERPERVKVCANEACRWAFYDDSRNRTRRWCDSSACGNVMKARRYRTRHRTRPVTGPD